MTFEQRRTAGKKSAITRGQNPWTERKDNYDLVEGMPRHVSTSFSEEEYLVMLYNSNFYCYAHGPGKVNRKISLIKDALNTAYHQGRPVRSLRSVNRKINKIIRKGK